jgi:hypothetical protein
MGGGDALFGSTHPDREYTFLHGDNAIEPGAGLGTGLTRQPVQRRVRICRWPSA